MKRVLVIGATGMFGQRLARHIAAHGPDVELIVTSRSRARAERLAREIGATGVALDTRRNLPKVLWDLHPFAAVDCSGPFQGMDHATARAVVARGTHAIDLADARDYLLGYRDALDRPARENGVAALAGASSTPALSGAVARRLVEGWTRVDTLDFAIVPGGRSEVGPAVLEAVTSYAGRPVPTWRDGALTTTTGWRGGRSIDVEGLGRRRVADVETVDAERLGPLFAVRDRVTFAAGLEAGVEQRGLEALAALRARGRVGDVRPLLPLLRAGRRLTRLFTGDCGGMVVRAQGVAHGRSVARSWTLVARDDDGPQVPTLAAAAALRALVEGRVAPGARLADEALTLDAIMAEARPYRIETRLDGDDVAAPALAA